MYELLNSTEQVKDFKYLNPGRELTDSDVGYTEATGFSHQELIPSDTLQPGGHEVDSEWTQRVIDGSFDPLLYWIWTG